MQGFDLSGVPGVQLFPYALSGMLNGNLDITGTADEPIIMGAVSLTAPAFEAFRFQEVATSFSYTKDMFELNAHVDDELSRLLSTRLAIPYHLSFEEPIAMPSPETLMEVDVLVNTFDLERVNSFVPELDARLDGSLTANLRFRNTISNPKMSGELAILEGEVAYDKYGIYYQDIALNSHFKNNTITLDSLNIHTAKGKLKAYGTTAIDSLFQGEVLNFDFNVKGTNFKIVDSEMASAVVNTNMSFTGTPEKPLINGDLTVMKSAFNVDLLMKEFNKVYDDAEQPMLVVARDAAMENIDVVDSQRDTLKKPTPDIYTNMKGQFDIEIPRNTWVKGKNMNFELAGNLKAIKDVNQLDLFGALNVKRGYYKLYGRQLNIEEGELTFTGGSTINPLVNFEIVYAFRDPDDELKSLKVVVTGRLLEPELAFYLDDVAIEEKDAISYLIFNKGINQLDTRESTTVLESNVDLALGQLSNFVKEALQNKIGLDVVEIKSNNGWTQSTISTGKYITNNLYLNYEHTFVFDKGDEVMDPDKVTLEYQFYKSLFLQATNQSSNSGFDLIYKWTWK